MIGRWPLRLNRRSALAPERRARGRRHGRAGRGQSLVEFVLVLPIFLILLFGIVDFGMGLRAYITLTNATREGARVGAVGELAGTYPADCNADPSDDATVVARVCTTLAGLDLDNVETVNVDYPDGFQTGNSIAVSAQYRYDFISPLAALVNGLTGGTIDDSLSLSSSADMRLE